MTCPRGGVDVLADMMVSAVTASIMIMGGGSAEVAWCMCLVACGLGLNFDSAAFLNF